MTIPAHFFVCFAGPQGIYHSSLVAFLRTLPGVDVLKQVSSQVELRGALRDSTESIFLIDVDLALGNLSSCLLSLRHSHPHAQIIALVNAAYEQQSALNAGADRALLKGFSSAQLRAIFTTAEVSTNEPAVVKKGVCT